LALDDAISAPVAWRSFLPVRSTGRLGSLKTMQIHAENGTVTLTGNVGSRAEKLLAEKVAQSVEGVRKVMNSLVAPEETQPQ